MMIISFAWTTGAFLAGIKTETRRFWDDKYMERFWSAVQNDNGLCQAWDRSPRFKGKRIGTIFITQKPERQKLELMTDQDEKNEGGLWGSAAKYREMMLSQGRGDNPYVIKFKTVAIILPDPNQLRL
jgi:hypothetical protein